MNKSDSILVVVAHPDDEVLGCGGMISRMAEIGHDVYIAVLGEGITSRKFENKKAEKDALEKLHANCIRAADLLGARDVFIGSFPDNRFDSVPLLKIVRTVEEIIERYKPRIVYSHHSGDLNIDHVITARAILTATRPVGNDSVRELYAFEIPSSTDWSFGQFESTFTPNTFVDIHRTLPKKVAAMELYESERKNFPHPRSAEAITAAAKKMGSIAGVEAAEGFSLIRRLIHD